MTNLLVERIGWTLIHFIWEGLAVALLLAIGLLVTRRCRSVVRYGLSCFALVLMAALPVATFWATAPLEPTVVERHTAHGTEKVAIFPSEAAARPIDVVVQPYLPGLVLGWGFGASLLALRLIGGLAQVERLRRRGKPASTEWQIRFHGAVQKLGLRRKVRLLESAHIAVPCALGIFRAVVILPTEMLTRLPANYIEALMLHELAHVRRHDYFFNLLQSILETVLFYHPAVWWVSKVVRDEREHCCDDIAVRVLGDPVTYANALTCLEEQRAALPRFSLAANGGSLLSRIQRLFGIQLPTRFAHSAWPIAVVLALTISATSAAVQAQPTKNKPVATKKKTSKKKGKLTKSAPKASAKAKSAGIAPSLTRAASTPAAHALVAPASAGTLRSAFAVRTVPAIGFGGSTSLPAAAIAAQNSAPGLLTSGGRGGGGFGGSSQLTGGVSSGGNGMSGGGGGFGGSSQLAGGASFGGNGVRSGGGGFGGGGMAQAVDAPISIQSTGSGFYRVTLKNALASDAIMELAKLDEIPVALDQVEPCTLTMYLPKVNGTQALEAMIRQANCTYRIEAGTYHILKETRPSAPEEAQPTDPNNITMDLSASDFRDSITQLAKVSRRSIVVNPGSYGPLSIHLSNVDFDQAIAAFCRAGNATYKVEGNIMYIDPKSK